MTKPRTLGQLVKRGCLGMLIFAGLCRAGLAKETKQTFASAGFSTTLLTKIAQLDYTAADIKDVQLIPEPMEMSQTLIREYYKFDDRGWAIVGDIKPLQQITPFFPWDERSTKNEDMTTGYVVISKSGEVLRVYVKYSRPSFAQSAALALRSWKFAPAARDRLAVIQLPFRMEETESRPPDIECRKPALRRELLEMRLLDQIVRKELIVSYRNAEEESVTERMAQSDKAHEERLKGIVGEHGWPSAADVGADGAEAAFLILQHSPDLEFQKRMLPAVRDESLGKRLPIECFAILQDRILVREGKPQLYGSQAKPVAQWGAEGPVLEPIEDPANVERRRAELGLEPLGFYLQGLKQLYLPDK